jgi:hypothetical protein
MINEIINKQYATSDQPEKRVEVSLKYFWQKYLYMIIRFVVPVLFLIIIFSFFSSETYSYNLYNIWADLKIYLIIIFFILFINIMNPIFNIIIGNNKEFLFYSDRIIEKNKKISLPRTFYYKDIGRVDIIKNDIISRMLGMEIIGINFIERSIMGAIKYADKRGLNRPATIKDVLDVFFLVISIFLFRGHSSSYLGANENKIIKTKNKGKNVYYKIMIYLPRNTSKDLKSFIDQKLKIKE